MKDAHFQVGEEVLVPSPGKPGGEVAKILRVAKIEGRVAYTLRMPDGRQQELDYSCVRGLRA